MATDSPVGVLAEVRAHRVAADAHEAAILRTAAAWADQHPPESIHDAACIPGTEGEVSLAGVGAPRVAEFACAELATALGIPTEWGARLMGDALELRHRLPRVWSRVMAGELQVWRARRISQATRHLSLEAAAWVDVQVAPFARRIGPAQTDRLIAAAVARFNPDLAEREREASADRRCFDVDHRQVSFAGTSRVYGELDLADALDLDAAVTAGAEQLAALGSTDSLDVRRAVAVGELARHQPGDRLVTADQVRSWCGGPETQVVVKPVIDLAHHVSVDAYEVPRPPRRDRVPVALAERVDLRPRPHRHPRCDRRAVAVPTRRVVPRGYPRTVPPPTGCLICDKHAEADPGLQVHRDALVYIGHLPASPEAYLGHLFVEPLEHRPGLGDLSPEQAAAVGSAMQHAATALRRAGHDHVYAFVLGDSVPHLHVHVIGRYPGTPVAFRGIRVDEWPEAPRGDAEAVAAYVARLRDFVRAAGPS